MIKGLAWTFFSIFALLSIIICYFIIKYYHSKKLSNGFSTFIATFSLVLPLLCFWILPVDVYSLTSKSFDHTSLKYGYYILFGIILVFMFILIPFAYFYSEDKGDEQTSQKSRIVWALIYTTITFIVIMVLFLIGLLAQPGSTPQKNESWSKSIFNNETKGDSAIIFSIACLLFISYFDFIKYTSYGISMFPISLIMKKNIKYQKEDVENQQKIITERLQAIEVKYATSGKKMSRSDRGQKKQLIAEQERLSLFSKEIKIKSDNCCITCCDKLKVFSRIFGVLFAIISLFLIICFLITIIEQIWKSKCGIKCGFLLEKPTNNPFDKLMVVLGKHFPLDFILLILVGAYLFICSFYAITRLQTRFLIWKMFSIYPHQTLSQGLLLLGMFLMGITLIIMFEMMTLAPQYSTFGSKKNSSGNNCTINDPEDECPHSQISIIYSRIVGKMPFFSVVFYIFNWIFSTFSVLYFFYGFFKKRKLQSQEERADYEILSDNDIN
ncbi:lysosomal cobalamin transporter-related [Anaeramoeba ignava]|uniref:Lysosomal cobalamin transporter-related n=1 Tax=Anaeramoeba ignava TaxID=1746090 RepID=A0A9Q0LLN7_ANAIG|nr:lysosomal cobalamin transporter-related [Anaeramoeba ignava]